MARFARECLIAMSDMTRQLEKTLGSDTADLGLKVGLHSGPVVAGKEIPCLFSSGHHIVGASQQN